MQKFLLEQVRLKNPDKPLAKVLSDILAISKDSAYRRIKNEIPLILPEVTKLCEAFDISLDHIIRSNQERESSTKNFSLLWNNNCYDEYSFLLRTMVDLIDPDNQEGAIYSLTDHIPFYYLANYPNIQKLDYYIRKRANGAYSESPLIGNDMPKEIGELFDMLKSRICEKRIVWVLSPFWLNNFFNNIQFFKKMEFISKKELELYKNDLVSLLNDMENDASIASENENSSLLISSIAFTGTTVLTSLKDKIYNLILFHNTNHLVSTDRSVNLELKAWIDNVCEKSINISRNTIVERRQFFDKMRSQVEEYMSVDNE